MPGAVAAGDTPTLDPPVSYEAGQIKQLRDVLEHVMDNVPWPDYRNPATQKIAAEFTKRANGRTFDTSGAFTYEALLVIADATTRTPARR